MFFNILSKIDFEAHVKLALTVMERAFISGLKIFHVYTYPDSFSVPRTPLGILATEHAS